MTGPEQISHLYQMAVEAHQGRTAVWSLRHAALDGIRAEVAKQPGVVDWLRDHMCLAMEPLPVPGLDGTTWWMVLVRDETISAGASRGTPAPTVEESAASAVVWHLAVVVAQAFAAEHGAGTARKITSPLKCKTLRQVTGAGLLDCQRALDECGDDFDRAADWLHSRGTGRG